MNYLPRACSLPLESDAVVLHDSMTPTNSGCQNAAVFLPGHSAKLGHLQQQHVAWHPSNHTGFPRYEIWLASVPTTASTQTAAITVIRRRIIDLRHQQDQTSGCLSWVSVHFLPPSPFFGRKPFKQKTEMSGNKIKMTKHNKMIKDGN